MNGNPVARCSVLLAQSEKRLHGLQGRRRQARLATSGTSAFNGRLIASLVNRMGRIVLLAVTFWIACTAGARAEIYEWEDAQGRHYADSLELIPKEARPNARLMIKEGPSPAAAANTPTPGMQSTEEEVETEFAAGWDRGFEAGWAAGFQAARDEQPVCPTEPEVIVLQSAPPITWNVPRYDPTGAYYRSPYVGSVTVPFDQGRSRGLTRREQMQRLQGR